MSRRDLQSDAPRLPERTAEQLKAGLRKPEQESPENVQLRSAEQDSNGLTKAERDASELLNEAFRNANLRNQEIAQLTGVSETMVIKWRSSTSRGAPSFPQMLCLPPRFYWELNKAMSARYGYARMALLELIEAAGALAVLVK
jgi:hypothetical protein